MNDLTDATPRHALPFLFAGQAQKEFTVNEALARIDMLLHPAISGQLATPPATPAIGSCYLVASGGHGAFSGHDHAIAGWDGEQWTFVEASAGMIATDIDTGQRLHFDGGWQAIAAPEAPSGGSNVDAEAREAISALIEGLRQSGIFS